MTCFSWIKSGIKRLVLPPPELEWRTGFSSWSEAVAASEGYEQGDILEATIAATRDVIAGRAAYERDGVVFDEVQYSWPLLAALLYVAQGRSSLRVVDVGGGLGGTYRQNRPMLEAVEHVMWRVVELKETAEAGAAEFSTAELSFSSDLSSSLRDGVDLALFGSTLCYLEEPGEALGLVAASEARYVIIDRTPFISASDHEVTVQHVRMSRYQVSYPCWRFSETYFEETMAAGWRQVLRWDCDLQPDPGAVNRGYLFERTG